MFISNKLFGDLYDAIFERKLRQWVSIFARTHHNLDGWLDIILSLLQDYYLNINGIVLHTVLVQNTS